MSDAHVFMLILDAVTVIYLAWSMGRVRAQMRQDRDTQQQFLRDALQPIAASAEHIAAMVRDLHRPR